MTHAKAGHSLAGSCFWSLAATGFPDYDGYKVNLLQQQTPTDEVRTSQPLHASKGSPAGKAAGQRRQREAASRRRVAAIDGESTGHALDAQTHAELGATGEAASTGEPPPPPPADMAHSSPRGLWRVSSAAQDKCEAAAGMFEGSPGRAERDACEQDVQTVALIRRHARQIMALNAPAAASRECALM